MVTVRFVCQHLEHAGMFDMHEGRQRLQTVRLLANNFLLWVLCGTHLYSTITRATRYTPELCQAVCEDAYLITSLICVDYFVIKTNKLMSILYFTENSFSKAHLKVTKVCEHKSRILFIAIILLCIGSGIGPILESQIPMSPKEMEIRRMVYRTQHPERRHPYYFRLPFTDETESWTFEIVFALILYGTYLFVCLIGLALSLCPITVIHTQGQYEILAAFIRKLGKRHMDAAGNEIFYTNIETNEFFCVPKKDKSRRRIDRKTLLMMQKAYEKQYLKQIVQFHHKLMKFNEMFLDLVSPIMILVIFTCTFVTATILCQLLLVNIRELSTIRVVKLVVQLFTILAGYFFIANMSEMSDDCHWLLRRALVNCDWTKCSIETQKGICILIRRVQRHHHLEFYDGALILSRALFLKTVKIAYSFVNFVRLGVKK